MNEGRRIGIDLGGTKCLGVAVRDDGSLIEELRAPTPEQAEAIVDTLAEVAGRLGPVASIGVGAPGLVDVDGVLRVAPNLEGVHNMPLRSLLEDRFPGVPVRIENDASSAGWAESQAGAAHGVEHAVLVTVGTGIGGGIIAEGRLLRGANGFAAEIGHMVVDPEGPPCPCGKRGCWEQMASGNALGRLGREAAAAGAGARLIEMAGGRSADIRGEHVTRAAVDGDQEALKVMADHARWLALGLANLAAIFDTGVFIVGGGLLGAGEVWLDEVRSAFGQTLLAAEHRPSIPIVAAKLGERAGAIGAAMLAGLHP